MTGHSLLSIHSKGKDPYTSLFRGSIEKERKNLFLSFILFSLLGGTKEWGLFWGHLPWSRSLESMAACWSFPCSLVMAVVTTAYSVVLSRPQRWHSWSWSRSHSSHSSSSCWAASSRLGWMCLWKMWAANLNELAYVRLHGRHLKTCIFLAGIPRWLVCTCCTCSSIRRSVPNSIRQLLQKVKRSPVLLTLSTDTRCRRMSGNLVLRLFRFSAPSMRTRHRRYCGQLIGVTRFSGLGLGSVDFPWPSDSDNVSSVVSSSLLLSSSSLLSSPTYGTSTMSLIFIVRDFQCDAVTTFVWWGARRARYARYHVWNIITKLCAGVAF